MRLGHTWEPKVVAASSPTLEMLGLDTLKPDWDIEPRLQLPWRVGQHILGNVLNPQPFPRRKISPNAPSAASRADPGLITWQKQGPLKVSQRPVGGGPQGAELVFPGDMKS